MIIRYLISAVMIVSTIGCAIHYYDPLTGTEHLWGVGHMKMRVHPEKHSLQAVVKEIDTVGVAVGVGKEDFYLTGGYNSRGDLQIFDDTVFSLYWPDNATDLFNVRIGTNMPSYLIRPNTNTDEK